MELYIGRHDVNVVMCLFRCAGLCRYEGYGGLCSISLSQPLLKLRPRKDLVETLLVIGNVSVELHAVSFVLL